VHFAPRLDTCTKLLGRTVLRVPAEDGKICVLDFGLMTEVTPTQRIALFEYIAHLTIQVGTGGCSGSLFCTCSH